jgi:hypothetical protein
MSPLAPKVPSSADVSVGVTQFVPVTVAVLVTVVPALFLNVTLTVAPAKQVPDAVAVLAVISESEIVLSSATLLITGAAKRASIVAAVTWPKADEKPPKLCLA